MIDRDLKRCLGQMMKGVQVVGASHAGLIRAYTSHWVCQVSFEEPVLLVSVSPKHDTHPLIVGSGRLAVSVLAGDQIDSGQYFSYPGHKFRYVASELIEEVDGWIVVPDAIAWLGCEVEERIAGRYDHDLFFVRVVTSGEGRLGEPPLLYSSRHGWRVAGAAARAPGDSVRDRLLARVASSLGPESDGDGD
ncbi:MAG: flavin reductase family protein [Actinomycetota bacterium]|nr:flavin reductase family protein [Actinomycetota bacterium]